MRLEFYPDSSGYIYNKVYTKNRHAKSFIDVKNRLKKQLFVAQVLINKVKSKCCGIKDKVKGKK